MKVISNTNRLQALPFDTLVHRCLRLTLPRFLAVGCLGLSTAAAVFSLCSAVGAPDAAARLVSLAIATSLTWRLNRRFTFDTSGRSKNAEAVRYVVVAVCAQGLNLAVFLAIRALTPALPALGALGVSAVLATGFSFTGQSLVTFRASLWAGRGSTD